MSGAATPAPVRIWLEVAHHGAHRAGGWAFVRADGAAVTGAAGGDRRVDAEAVALAGLVAALKTRVAGRALEVMTTSALVAGIPARIAAAGTGGEAPAANLPLWAEAAAALATGEARLVRAAGGAGTPSAFAASWAELARDKAKGGAFAWPIPKPNLAKAGV